MEMQQYSTVVARVNATQTSPPPQQQQSTQATTTTPPPPATNTTAAAAAETEQATTAGICEKKETGDSGETSSASCQASTTTETSETASANAPQVSSPGWEVLEYFLFFNQNIFSVEASGRDRNSS